MKNVKILFQGDSVTDEERDRNDPHHLGKGYAKFAAQRLKEVFPQKQLEFLNLGISGNKSGDLLERWEKDCIAVQPNIVCFMIGINDVWHSYAHGLDITTEEYSENCRRMLEALKSKTKAGLVVMEPFLLDRALSREYADILVPLDGMMTAAAIEYRNEDLTFDGVHPKEAGARLIGGWASEAIGKVIDKYDF